MSEKTYKAEKNDIYIYICCLLSVKRGKYCPFTVLRMVMVVKAVGSQPSFFEKLCGMSHALEFSVFQEGASSISLQGV